MMRLGKTYSAACVAGANQYYMRALHTDYRPTWVASINDSIATLDAAMAKAKLHHASGSSQAALASESERHTRLTDALAAIAPAQRAFVGELSRLQGALGSYGGTAIECGLKLRAPLS
jgi:hypothetical protein